MNDSEKLQYLAGEVNGLRTVLMALVSTHPNPASLGVELAKLIELQLRLANPLPVTEYSIKGQEATTDAFKAFVREIDSRQE